MVNCKLEFFPKLIITVVPGIKTVLANLEPFHAVLTLNLEDKNHIYNAMFLSVFFKTVLNFRKIFPSPLPFFPFKVVAKC